MPLVLLTGLNLVDEFDRMAFATLTPEIRDAFALSDTGIVALNVVVGALLVVAALPMGLLTDRFHRVRLAIGSALLWGTMSVLTGVVPTVALLFAVRLLAGLGRTANEVVHPSLLNDYYPLRALPTVFMIHRLANPAGLVSAIAAGAIASSLSWPWAFVLLSIPTFVLLVAAARLREPLRGETTDREPVVGVTSPLRFGAGRRHLFGLRSLRRLWLASFLIGTGAINVTQFLTLFFERVYGFGSVARGVVVASYGAGVVVGLLVGAVVANRVVAAGDDAGLARITGVSGLFFASGMALAVASPWAPLSLAAVVVVGTGTGGFQPAYYPLVGRLAPARFRGQAYAWTLLFVGLGALLAIVIGAIGEAAGWRTALAVVAGTVAIAGLIARSAHRFVQSDLAARLAPEGHR